MATINFYLKHTPNKKGERLILLTYQHKGKKLNHSTNLKILPKFWDSEKQRVKSQCPNAVDINAFLTALKSKTTKAMLDAKTNDQEPTVKYVRDRLFQPQKSTVTPLTVFEDFIKSRQKTHSAAVVQRFCRIKEDLEAYQIFAKKELGFEDFDALFFEQFGAFLLTEKNNVNNTAAKKQSFLKTFLKWTVVAKIQPHRDFEQTKLLRQNKTQHIALVEEELQKLASLDLSQQPKLSEARDLFCFGCYTGLRHSDIDNLKSDNLIETPNGKALKILIKKTRTDLLLPLSTPALEILERYQFELPRIGNAQANTALKEIGRLAGFDKSVRKIVFQGTNRLENSRKKYEAMTMHTARRTFATLSAIRGMNLATLQQILGHSTIQQTMEYIKDTDNVKAAEMLRVWG